MSLSNRARNLSLTAVVAGAVALVVALLTLAAPATASGRCAPSRCRAHRPRLLRQAARLSGQAPGRIRRRRGDSDAFDRGGGAARLPTRRGRAGFAPTSPGSTNVQEAGVDEPDIVKTSGSTIFTRRRRHPASDRHGLGHADTRGAPGATGRRRRRSLGRQLPAAHRGRSSARDRQLLRLRDPVRGRRCRRSGRTRRRLSERAAARLDRRDRYLRPRRDVDPAHREGRRLVHQRPADRLDRAPRDLELSVRPVPGRREGPQAAAAVHGPRPDHARDAARTARQLLRGQPPGSLLRHRDALGDDRRSRARPARGRRRLDPHGRPHRLRVDRRALRQH